MSGENGSGLWSSFVFDRDPNLADGILQGASIDYWGSVKSVGMLKAVIDSRENQKSQTKKLL
jgi:hypothetical protein